MHFIRNLARRAFFLGAIALGVGALLMLPGWALGAALLVAVVITSRLPSGRQMYEVACIAVTTIPQRLGSSAVVIIAIAGVVGVLVALLSMAVGLEQTLKQTGSEDIAIVLARGTTNEASSVLPNEVLSIVPELPQVARNAQNRPIVSAERLIVASLQKRSTGLEAGAAVRGVGEGIWELRPEIRIIAGRRFASGLREFIVGRGAQHEFEHLDLGAEVSIEGQPWRVVGVFDSGDAHNSELWGDMEVVGSAYRRAGIVTSIKLRLSSAAAFADFKNSLQVDPRLKVDTQTTRAYYGAQSGALVAAIKIMGALIAVIMAVGATFGALNATHTAISSRAGEIATLRAIGFRSRPVITSLLLETLLLSLAGGLLGAVIAWLLFDGFTTSTFGSAGQVVFAFSVSQELLFTGIRLALAMGLVGGLVPALAAARSPIPSGLKAR